MIDPAEIASLAQRFSLPPSLVKALDGQVLPQSALQTYGLDEKSDPTALLTVAAHAVSQAISMGEKDVQAALSQVFAGDPQAYKNSLSPESGIVTGILARAAVGANEGMDRYNPTNSTIFHSAATGLTEFMKQMAEAGGAVGASQIQAFSKAAQKFAPQQNQALQVHPNAPVPKGPPPEQVADFAKQVKGLGIDIDHFLQHYPTFSKLNYKMLNKPTQLEDYAEVNGMTRAEMLEHVRSQPHPVYSHLTAGQFSDTQGTALLHSMGTLGTPPPDALVAHMASSGAKWNDMSNFFQGLKNASK